MRQWDGSCPVCRQEGVAGTPIESGEPHETTVAWENITYRQPATLIECPNCGAFAVTDRDRINLLSPSNDWNPRHLSALLREQSVSPLCDYWLQCGERAYGKLARTDLTAIGLNELLSRWPRTVSERINRTLINLARMSKLAGQSLTIEYERKDIALAFGEKSGDAFFHVDSLIRRGDLQQVGRHNTKESDAVVSPAGWERFESLIGGRSDRHNPVFVAMWFGAPRQDGDADRSEEMTQVFKTGIEPAVRRAGYNVTRVDLEQFNECIMDKVLGDIRAAPFVIADFTGHRNGVYLEAGFARGLGTVVVNTCSAAESGGSHFDIRHLNNIYWKDTVDLESRLFERIRGTVGEGPYLSGTPRIAAAGA